MLTGRTSPVSAPVYVATDWALELVTKFTIGARRG